MDYNPWANPTFASGSAPPPAYPEQEPAMQSETFANPAVHGIINYLAQMPKRILGNSQFALDTGTYDPAPTLEAATLPMGTGAIAGVPVRAGEAVMGAGPIRAYHGSPHDFDAFSLDKIGTGEGAQAYGHGLYFAESPGVAQSYRDALSRTVTGDPGFDLATHAANQTTLRNNTRGVPDFDKAIHDLNGEISGYDKRGWPSPDYRQQYDSALEHLNQWKDAGTIPPKGKMYEVNINANPEHFLDWDKPLSEQHPQTQDAIKKAMGVDYYGNHDPVKAEKLWKEFGNSQAGPAVRQGFIASDDKLVADRLNQAGIPGIKYLDQGSRASGEGSRNYVVFNDKLIDIMRKYAVPAMFGGAMGAPIFANGQKQ